MGTYQYPSDDGNNYQLGTPLDDFQAAAGSLPAGDPSNPVYPFFWKPRALLLTIAPNMGVPLDGVTYRIASTTTDTTFILGVGSLVTVDGVTYVVTKILGESRTE